MACAMNSATAMITTMTTTSTHTSIVNNADARSVSTTQKFRPSPFPKAMRHMLPTTSSEASARNVAGKRNKIY